MSYYATNNLHMSAIIKYLLISNLNNDIYCIIYRLYVATTLTKLVGSINELIPTSMAILYDGSMAYCDICLGPAIRKFIYSTKRAIYQEYYCSYCYLAQFKCIPCFSLRHISYQLTASNKK